MTGPGGPRRGRHASPDDTGVEPSTSWWPSPAQDVPARRAPGWRIEPPARGDDGGTDPWHDELRARTAEPRSAGIARETSGHEVRAEQAADRWAGTWEAETRQPGAWQPGTWQPGAWQPGTWQQATADTGERSYGRTAGARDHTDRPGRRRSGPGLLERRPEDIDPLGPQGRHRTPGEDGTGPIEGARRRGAEPAGSPAAGAHPSGGRAASAGTHPSAPLPPLPTSAWARLNRSDGADDDTRAATAVPATPGSADHAADAWASGAHPFGGDEVTRGLDLVGADLHGGEDGGEDAHARGWLPDDREHVDDDHVEDEHLDHHVEHGHLDDHHLDEHHRDDHHLDEHHRDEHADDHADEHADDPVPLRADDVPVDRGRIRRRRRRRRLALLVSLVVLAGLAVGIVVGGRQVLGLVDPPDYTGQGTGTVRVRVHDGDTLKAIAQTMVDDGVIASVRPFVKAAEAEPQATGVAPGIYGLRHHMSAKAALDRLLQPSSRLVSRVTVPEGLTAAVTIQKVAQLTGTPVAQLQAAAANPTALGLPAYANGNVEGFLFPATYDFEPGTTPTDMLKAMVARAEQAMDELSIPDAQRQQLLTEASIVQAEGKTPDDMAKIARVLDNRLAIGMPLQLDTTVNYANGKNGVTTTPQDRANPSPYNTYLHAGLPPGPISNPGEEALRAVLTPAQGQWLYFVVVNPDTGETRFAVTEQEAQANVQLFQQWLREHPGR